MLRPMIELKKRLKNGMLDAEILEERGLYSLAARVINCYVSMRFNDGDIAVSMFTNGQSRSRVLESPERAYTYIETRANIMSKTRVNVARLNLASDTVVRMLRHLKNGRREEARELLPIVNEEAAQIVLDLIAQSGAAGEDLLLEESRTPVPEKHQVPDAGDGLPF